MGRIQIGGRRNLFFYNLTGEGAREVLIALASCIHTITLKTLISELFNFSAIHSFDVVHQRVFVTNTKKIAF
jgi:hypothetical protein